MNEETKNQGGIPSWILPLLGGGEDVDFNGEELAEASRIIRRNAEAYRDSVVVPFESSKFHDAVQDGGRLAAAATDMQGRFTVLRVEEGTGEGVTYSSVGLADLVEGPYEGDDGSVFAVWDWLPGDGFGDIAATVAIVVDQSSGAECGRGFLRETPAGARIVLETGRMELLAGIRGNTHAILLIA